MKKKKFDIFKIDQSDGSIWYFVVNIGDAFIGGKTRKKAIKNANKHIKCPYLNARFNDKKHRESCVQNFTSLCGSIHEDRCEYYKHPYGGCKKGYTE